MKAPKATRDASGSSGVLVYCIGLAPWPCSGYSNAIMDGEQQMSSEPQPECPGCHALRKEVAELRRIIEEFRRAGKRQAGPFSKGPRKPKPKRPGRKPGEDV